MWASLCYHPEEVISLIVIRIVEKPVADVADRIHKSPCNLLHGRCRNKPCAALAHRLLQDSPMPAKTTGVAVWTSVSVLGLPGVGQMQALLFGRPRQIHSGYDRFIVHYFSFLACNRLPFRACPVLISIVVAPAITEECSQGSLLSRMTSSLAPSQRE